MGFYPKLAANAQVLLQVGYFITSRPELLPGFFKVEDNILLLGFVRRLELKLIANYSRRYQRTAPLAAILLLCVRLS